MKTNDELHYHQLRWMSASAAHYKHWLGNEHKQTKPQLLGEALDAMLFNSKEVLVFEGNSRRGKAWDVFADSNPESVKLLSSEYDTVTGMLASVQGHSEAMQLLSGIRQKFILWEMAGRKCGGTPDVFTETKVVELKSARSAHPDKFMWDARKIGYHAQLAWYHNALKILGLVAPDALCSIVAVESAPPYPVTIFDLTTECYTEGEKLWRSWFEQLLVCEQSNSFPPYALARVRFEARDTESITLKIDGEDVEIE